MNRTTLLSTAFSALSVFSTGCFMPPRAASAAQTGCSPDEIKIDNDDLGFFGGRSWEATCQGKKFYCYSAKNALSCREEMKPVVERQAPVAPVAVTPVSAPTHYWADYTFERCGVAAPLPGAPEERRTVAETAVGKLAVYTATVYTAAFSATIGCTPVPGPERTDTASALDDARDGLVRSVGGTLEREASVEIDGNPGRDLWYRVGNTFGRVRLVLRGRTLVSAVLTPLTEFSPAEIRTMFDGMTVRQPTARAGRRAAQL